MFGPFPESFRQKKFFQKIGLSCKTSKGFLAPCQNPEKSNDRIPKKHPNRCQEGRMDRPYFIGSFLLLLGGLTSTTTVAWHLKVEDKNCDVGLTKNYCITVSMQKISSIHKLIQQILGSHELNDHAHFRPGPTFTFLKFAPTCQKSVHCINSFLRYSQF